MASALQSQPELLVAAFLRCVRRLFSAASDQIEWTSALQQQALLGSDTGIAAALTNLQDYSSTSISASSSNTAWLREMPALDVAKLCEMVLQRLDAEVEAGGADKLPLPGASTYGSFD